MTNKEYDNKQASNKELSKEVEANKEKNDETSQMILSTASGSDAILIKNHNLFYEEREGIPGAVTGVEFEATNISDNLIGGADFEVIFCDADGSVLNTRNYKVINWPPNYSRTIRISSSLADMNSIKSYQLKLLKTATAPEPAVNGNEKLTVLKHKFMDACEDRGLESAAGVEIALRNGSEKTIATAAFEAVFFDIEGNVVATIKHYEFEIKPGFSRSIYISSNIEEAEVVKSYDVKIKRITTTDVEKVQLRWKKIATNENSEEEISGAVKNISDNRIDTVLFATFFDRDNENIGTKTVILRDIEPGTVRQFQFKFKPQQGDKVVTCVLNVADLIE
ncbi:MAG: FxLYD domain-containing protein [Dehalococcoidales bacterium]|nr:FxLYD domain-containing protein [Dehalococcoidales bacterium]